MFRQAVVLSMMAKRYSRLGCHWSTRFSMKYHLIVRIKKHHLVPQFVQTMKYEIKNQKRTKIG